MVAIVSGNSLGLSLSSLAILGQRGALGTAGQGRSGEQTFVNLASGNLVLQNRDDVLAGRGLDVNAVRTYNSQGLLNDDNADNWAVAAFGRSVVLTSGTLGAAGSTVRREDAGVVGADAFGLAVLLDEFVDDCQDRRRVLAGHPLQVQAGPRAAVHRPEHRV